MLLKITEFKDLDERKLMDIYSESNFENTDDGLIESELYKELGILTKDKDRWEESITR